MKRRAFLGFMGGAVAAGPKLAADIAGNATVGQWVPPPPGLMSASSAAPDGDWRLSRIAKIKDLLGGKVVSAEERKRNRLYQIEAMERHRLDGLRSVSAQHKMHMLIEGNLERQERINRLHLEQELADLLKKPFGL